MVVVVFDDGDFDERFLEGIRGWRGRFQAVTKPST
jgi:hypothetical protein